MSLILLLATFLGSIMGTGSKSDFPDLLLLQVGYENTYGK